MIVHPTKMLITTMVPALGILRATAMIVGSRWIRRIARMAIKVLTFQ